MSTDQKNKDDFEKASTENRMTDIPDYRNTTDDIRQTLDMIIEGAGEMTEEKAASFGNEVLGQVQHTSNQIIHAMQDEDNGAFKEPLEQALSDMASMDLEGLQGKVSEYVRSGGNYVKKNKGKAALLGGALIVAPFAAAAAAVGYQGLKSYLPKKQEEVSMEDIATRIQSGVVKSEEHVKNLEMAQKHVPVLLERIEGLRQSNKAAFVGTTYHIGAGREILLRLQETELADAERAQFENPGFENEDKLSEVKEICASLAHQLTILEMARNESVTSSMALRDMKSAINENARSLRSLLTTEVPGWRRTLATAGMALDTYETTKVAAEFRNHLDRTLDDTVHATNEAMVATEQGRADHPERLEKMIERTIQLRENVEKRLALSNQMDEAIAERRLRLESETAELLVTNNNQQLLEAPDTDKPAQITKQDIAADGEIVDDAEVVEAEVITPAAPAPTPKP